MGAAGSSLARTRSRRRRRRRDAGKEAAQRAPGTAEEDSYPARVILRGLVRRADLNGTLCLVEGAQVDAGAQIKFRVRAEDGTAFLVHAKNLDFLQNVEVGDLVALRAVRACRLLMKAAKDGPSSLESAEGQVDRIHEDGHVVVLVKCQDKARVLLVRARLDQVRLVEKGPAATLLLSAKDGGDSFEPEAEIDVRIPEAEVLAENADDAAIFENKKAHEVAKMAYWYPGEYSKVQGLETSALNGKRCVVVGRSKKKQCRMVVQIVGDRGENDATPKDLREVSVDAARLCARSVAAPLLWSTGCMAILHGLRSADAEHLNGRQCFVRGRAPAPELTRLCVSVRDPHRGNRVRLLSVRADRLMWPFANTMPPVANTATPVDTSWWLDAS